MRAYIFKEKPMLIYWEITQACDLACKHCRAEAIPNRHPLELTFDEAVNIVDEITKFGRPYPHIVLTGGDIMHRPDIFDIIAYIKRKGLNVSVSPSATKRLDYEAIKEFKRLGVHSISLSLDGSDSTKHDEFRGVSGCFEWTIKAMENTINVGIPLQINTLVSAETFEDIPNIYDMLRNFPILRWSVFFLVETGRGKNLKSITPSQAEYLLNRLYEWMKEAEFAIKTTECMHFRRVVYSRMVSEGYKHGEILRSPGGRGFGIRDGNGIMFISHIGEVYPSGFLPISAGNVRGKSPVHIYRESRLFNDLRDPDKFKGKCGRCEFRYICGGSRARAFASTGNPLESDPLCPYIPKGNGVIA